MSMVSKLHIYDGEADRLMHGVGDGAQIILLPDETSTKSPDGKRRARIMWGQNLLEDLVVGRYRTLICAVNSEDNSRGIIAQLARLLPTSQWSEKTITAHARRFSSPDEPVRVIKYDMDAVEVLAILRPPTQDHLTLLDLTRAFQVATEMVRRRTERLPVATVSFLGARSNQLRDDQGQEPSFETVLRTMHEAGFEGDVYPTPAMWELAPTAVYARYPFPPSLDSMREGGF